MQPHKETYNGCRIEISEQEKLFINNKEIDYILDPSVDKYITRYLPYTQYDSLIEMARVIVATSPDFTGTTQEQ